MAEAFVKSLFNDKYEVYSAGLQPTSVNPLVTKAMTEVNIDISGNQAKSIEKFLSMDFDIVITVCDSAKESCPFLPGAKNFLHKSFPDPSSFTGSEDSVLDEIRKVRDEIKAWVEKMFGGS
jgi:arsenate reductase